MDKENELRRSKRNALLLLLIAAALFVITLFLPQNFWVNGVKAISEAAMVGALADWFAVVALFKRAHPLHCRPHRNYSEKQAQDCR
jgi:uncharacterized membrane-anchored protein YjiN (DUF445 family)